MFLRAGQSSYKTPFLVDFELIQKSHFWHRPDSRPRLLGNGVEMEDLIHRDDEVNTVTIVQ